MIVVGHLAKKIDIGQGNFYSGIWYTPEPYPFYNLLTSSTIGKKIKKIKKHNQRFENNKEVPVTYSEKKLNEASPNFFKIKMIFR